MNLKQLNNEEINDIYNEHMKIDFPTEELKPIDVIQKLINREMYTGYGLYNNGELLAYAFLATAKSYLLIDYYAVCRGYRNKGTGSEFINMLREKCKKYNGIIVEVEKVEDASNKAEKVIRRRRIDFYKKNEMRMTNISSTLFNVNYSIMCLCNVELEDSAIYEGLKDIYKEIIPNKFYLKYVKIVCK